MKDLLRAELFGRQPLLVRIARQRFDIVLNDLCGVAWTTKEVKLQSDGTPWRPLVHVLDICQAIHLSLLAIVIAQGIGQYAEKPAVQ